MAANSYNKRVSEPLRQKIASLPTKPGVYLHKDASSKILYVGKAKNLRNRVRSYFQRKPDHDAKTVALVAKVADVDVIVTRSEVEALLLESNFIKQYKPPYNVVLRDDKHYLFVKITSDDLPRVTTVRRVADDGGKYFGPYTSAYSLRSTLKHLRKAFPYAVPGDPCDDKHRGRPCLDYHIGLCPAVQHGKTSPEDYRRTLAEVARVLKGQSDALLKRFQAEMQQAAKHHQYERAAAARDRLAHLEAIRHDQQAVDTKRANRDVVGLARDKGHAIVTLLNVREGKVVARNHFTFWGEGEASDGEVLDGFLGQYYKEATNLPDEVLVPEQSDNAPLVARLLADRRGKRTPVAVPARGTRRKLVDLANQNAKQHLRDLRREWMADQQRTDQALSELRTALDLPSAPHRIECFDISTLSGTSTVGSMVVFRDGKPAKAHYRRFRIKHVTGIDDFAAMREVLGRRFAKVAKSERSDDDSFGVLPDLVIIDGGKGQVSAAAQVLEDIGCGQLPMIGLAKRLEEVVRYRKDQGDFTVEQLPASSQGLYLLQRVRDEAHRFAITYNRQMRSKRTVRSALDELPGIGPKRKKDLLRRFGSVARIRQAGLPEIEAVVGKAAGKVVKENL